MIEIHAEARANLDRKASDLIPLVGVLNLDSPQEATGTHHFVKHTITEKDIIGDIVLNVTDHNNKRIGFGVGRKGKSVGLVGENFATFQRVVDLVVNVGKIGSLASSKYADDKLIEWLIQRYDGDQHLEFCQYFLELLEKDCTSLRVYIPVPFTTSEIDFKLGQVDFTTLTEEMLRGWITGKGGSDNQKTVDLFLQRMQPEFQGYLFASIGCFAEKYKAKEIAYSIISDALAILRIFTPATRSATKTTGIFEYGWKYQETEIFFAIPESKETVHFSEGIRDQNQAHFRKTFVERLLSSDFHRLLLLETRTEFQEELMTALRIYSKSSLKKDIYDKLLYVLVSLETLLLRNDNEPIQQNLSDRIAFACGGSIEARREIVSLTKKVYGIRSRFIHHGQPSFDDEITIEKFLALSFVMFESLLSNMDKFKTKMACIDGIEEIKYS